MAIISGENHWTSPSLNERILLNPSLVILGNLEAFLKKKTFIEPLIDSPGDKGVLVK